MASSSSSSSSSVVINALNLAQSWCSELVFGGLATSSSSSGGERKHRRETALEPLLG